MPSFSLVVSAFRPHSVLQRAACLALLATGLALPAAAAAPKLSAVPPMGWNDWAHYQCGFTAKTILANAQALVSTGLAKQGYNTVTIDDCWMLKDRDARGNLQVDPQRFPQGMKPVADQIHKLGLKFGIYEDAGYLTCGGYAGSGVPNGGGNDHFLQDAKLFASWGVNYLKLDGCNVYVPKGGDMNAAYRSAYAAEARALHDVGGTIAFSESAPAYFQGEPSWYDVLSWVRGYGQLWREGTDVEIYREKRPNAPRFHSVLWNYAYNLPLARYQTPGNWNDADFIIGGDSGMTAAESHSQFALWAMMSAPLILSSDLAKLSPATLQMLENHSILAVDQDPLGKEASLVRRTPASDVLFKQLRGGDYAAAVLNRGGADLPVQLDPALLGFHGNGCTLQATDLWTGSSTGTLATTVHAHDTAIWRIHPAAACGAPSRTGTITTIIAKGENQDSATYGRCLSAAGSVGGCTGGATEHWTVTADGALQIGQQCLTPANGHVTMQACGAPSQHWHYALSGNLVSQNGQCLTATGPVPAKQGIGLAACGHNLPNQVWALPTQ